AQQAYMAELAKERADLQAELAEAKKPAATAATKPGVAPLASTGTSSPAAVTGDPIAAFEAAVEEKVKLGMKQHEAIKAVARSNEELRASYVAAHTAR